MEMIILGTAASEGWPALFCGCNTCCRARETGGPNIRSRTSLQIGRRHKIDLPPDTWYHVAHFGLDLSRLEHLFITHSHGDHFAVDNLQYLEEPFAHNRSGHVSVYGNADVISLAAERLGPKGRYPVVLREIELFRSVQAGDLTFTPILADHKPRESSFNYVITWGDQTVLYACDTGWYSEETWSFLEGIRLTCIIAECTAGPVPCDRYHLDFEHLFAMKDRLERVGAFCEGVFVATHFSHNVGLLHHEIEEVLGSRGIQAAYDGMVLSLSGGSSTFESSEG